MNWFEPAAALGRRNHAPSFGPVPEAALAIFGELLNEVCPTIRMNSHPT
jgi:hypothetical protein